MPTDRFSMSEAISFGWNTMKANFVFFIGITIIVLAFQFYDFILQDFLHIYKMDTASLFSLPFLIHVFIVSFVVYSIVNIGLIKISLSFCDSQKGKYSDFVTSLHLFFKFFIV